MIPEAVTLTFDPGQTREVKKVFSNNLARTLWLAIKPGHLTNQFFNDDCLHYAKTIEDIKKKKLLTAKLLLNILSGAGKPPGHAVIGKDELGFATELLPFINGDKTMNFTVELGGARKEVPELHLSGFNPGKLR